MAGRRGASSFGVAGYRQLWLTGLLWHTSRWMALLVSTYRVNELTGDPLLVLLVGTAFFAPMFLGGALAGTISDRFDRYRTVGSSLGTLAPLAVLMGVGMLIDKAPLAVIYAFVGALGVGNVIDMTARRSMCFDLVGNDLVTNSAALESLALHCGTMIGSLTGGALLAALGPGQVFLGLAVVYVMALASLLASRHLNAVPDRPAVAETPSLRNDFDDAIDLIRSHELLRRFLVITVLMNFFYYAFTPLVPVFAERMEVGPFLTGVLASSIGFGTMMGAYLLSRIQPDRRGMFHIVGTIGAMTMLIAFANTGIYWVGLPMLILAGLFGAGFSTTQAALVVSMVDDRVRGRAMGVLSMAIGALPFGMFTLGLVARRTDPVVAVTISVGVGIALVFLWQLRRPELRRL